MYYICLSEKEKEIILRRGLFQESSFLNWSENISEQFYFCICDARNVVAKISWNFNELATFSDSDRHITHL